VTETVRIVSALSTLMQGVQAYFLAQGSDAAVLFGYRQRAQQLNQGVGGANRVIFLPGDPNGNGGKIATAPRDVGRRDIYDASDPPVRVAELRPLASWERQFAIAIWGWDASAPRDELAQAAATEDLFERTIQALEQVPGVGGPNLAWGAVNWTLPKESTYGAELIVGLQLAHPLMDAPDYVAYPTPTLKRVGEDI
jgi:hypothetical protein